MATYTCATCGNTSENPTGWARAQITHTHYVSGDPPTVTADADLVVVDFDTDTCRDAWNARARLPGPA
jgi:hypothetical protein